MIDRHFITKNLDTDIWKRLGELLNLLFPPEKTLHILIDEERIIRSCTSTNQSMELEEPAGQIDDSYAKVLFAGDDSLAVVMVYSLASLTDYYRKVQDISCCGLDADQYLAYLWETLAESPGIRVFRREKKRKPWFSLLQDLLLPLPADHISDIQISFAGEGFFRVILTVKKGKIICVEAPGLHIQKEAAQMGGLPVYIHSLAVENTWEL